jgi:DNA-binding GntR family transcriptional regulator
MMVQIERIERPETLLSLAYERIKGLLVSGELKQDIIYSANQFAEMLGVSRTPVREALLQLSAEGLLIAVQGRGFKIREFSQKEIRDFFETRLMIETYIIEHLTASIEEEDIQALEESLKQMGHFSEQKDPYGFLEADKTFHMCLVHRYRNNLLGSIMENIRNLISILGRKALTIAGRSEEVLKEHHLVLDGLRSRNAVKASQAMRQHLNVTENYIIETL